MRVVLLVSLAIGLVCYVSTARIPRRVLQAQEEEVFQYLEDIETEILARRNAASEANWAYDSNITDDNLDVKNEVATENAAFFKVRGCTASNRYMWLRNIVVFLTCCTANFGIPLPVRV